jgi:hypothetical protein
VTNPAIFGKRGPMYTTKLRRIPDSQKPLGMSEILSGIIFPSASRQEHAVGNVSTGKSIIPYG